MFLPSKPPITSRPRSTVTITGWPVLKLSFSSYHLCAVSYGTLLLRDTEKQVQDITTLSRDVEHANNALSSIQALAGSDCQRCIAVSGTVGERRYDTEGRKQSHGIGYRNQRDDGCDWC
ncbi:hypothetical protein [Pectobacterium versatile]|uniref:hypothetical protein n=1 Tax=Pectobacterium versatile TaxID=2488639 RepID=UPI002B2471AE|nr:hypothetical protein [Pectobacterium versatile]